LAQSIVAYREAHGPFNDIQDLLDVPGIGPAKLEMIRGFVTAE
jgi:competence protein ComEA